MLYVDIPTRDEMISLSGVNAPGCVSIYLSTTPITQDITASIIELGNFTRSAAELLATAGVDKAEIAGMTEMLNELSEDSEFWRFQAHSLAIFVSPGHIHTYRLPNELTPMVRVSDRFHLKPLYRSITFPQSAFVLSLSENAVSLLEIHADLPPTEIQVEDLPKDAASAAGKSTLNDRGHSRRIVGTEGQNLRLEQYARKVDSALRPVLSGRETPLILAATGRLVAIFRKVNSYPHLLDQEISDSPDRMKDGALSLAARPVLDAAYEKELEDLRGLFERRTGERRTTTDISDAARAATYGAIHTLMVDIDTVVPGTVDPDSGAVEFAEEDDGTAYGIVDEIVARAFATGARIVAVRRDDLPEQKELAAILRHPL